MKSPVHTVAETEAFTRRRQKLGLSATAYAALLDVYAANPRHGEVIVGTGGLRKGRVAREHGGKSGGYRVFSLFFDLSAPVYLLWLIDKSDEETITAEQKKAFKAVIAQI